VTATSSPGTSSAIRLLDLREVALDPAEILAAVE
jgi:hypothetical protein